MKKIIVFISEECGPLAYVILIFAIPILIGVYMAIQVVKDSPGIFISELIISCVLGCFIGILSVFCKALESSDYDIIYIFGTIIALSLTIINYNVLFDEEKVLYKILAFVSMIFPAIILALIFVVTSIISYLIAQKIKAS